MSGRRRGQECSGSFWSSCWRQTRMTVMHYTTCLTMHFVNAEEKSIYK